MHSPGLLYGPYLQCVALNMFLVEFERVLRILFDALDEFPSGVPWAAQYFRERHVDACCMLSGANEHRKYTRVLIAFSKMNVINYHAYNLRPQI